MLVVERGSNVLLSAYFRLRVDLKVYGNRTESSAFELNLLYKFSLSVFFFSVAFLDFGRITKNRIVYAFESTFSLAVLHSVKKIVPRIRGLQEVKKMFHKEVREKMNVHRTCVGLPILKSFFGFYQHTLSAWAN